MKESIAHNKSKSFGARIIKLHRYLKVKKVPASLCDQVLRSGTSVSANLAEAYFGLSKRDFLYKVSLALKECNETGNWIDVLHNASYLNFREYESIKADCDELCKILGAIVRTTKRNLGISDV